MPTKGKTLPTPGARTKAERDSDYDRRRATNPALAEAMRIRSGARWQRFRKWFKQKHPTCCDPLGIHRGEVVPTQDPHHIIGLAKRPDLAYVEDNVAPLCRACHARVEGMVRVGKDTVGLFRGGAGEIATAF